jgi:hypothetical protein
MLKCIVCNNLDAKKQPGAGDFARFDCPRCGAFVLGGSAESELERAPLRRSLMSHTLRRMQLPHDKHLHVITSDELPTFWKDIRLPPPPEQADNLILWIGDNQNAVLDFPETTPYALAALVGLPVSSPLGDYEGIRWLYGQVGRDRLYVMNEVPGTTQLAFSLHIMAGKSTAN